MAFNIGKVKEYNGVSGTIVTADDSYMFLDSDVNSKISAGDLVKFRAEKVNETNRAFFVKQYNEDILNVDQQYQIREDEIDPNLVNQIKPPYEKH